jgi:hypothetical protein
MASRGRAHRARPAPRHRRGPRPFQPSLAATSPQPRRHGGGLLRGRARVRAAGRPGRYDRDPRQAPPTARIKSHAAGASRTHSCSRIEAPPQASARYLDGDVTAARRRRRPQRLTTARIKSQTAGASRANHACSLQIEEHHVTGAVQGSPCDGDGPSRRLDLVNDARRLVVGMDAAAASWRTPARPGRATLRASARQREPRTTR